MGVDSGFLYVGTQNTVTGTEVWRYDGTTWNQINTDGFGDARNALSFSMAASIGDLYVGTDNATTGTQIWRYDGTAWNQINTNGFGDTNNASSVSVTVASGRLYVGTENTTTGAEVWQLTVPDFTSQSECLFGWAERTFPDWFAPGGAASNTLAPYYYRYYSQTNAYLATSSADNHVYYLGPLSPNSILDVGPLAGWLSAAGCQ
jgi:hypothetical protein